MKKKHRPTGCAKFLIVVSIATIVGFIGASIYQGENPVENIKNFFSSNEKKEPSSQKIDPNQKDCWQIVNDLEAKIEELNKEIQTLKNQSN